jgi:DNA-binding transcriptional ArsR family regulator
MQMATVNSVVWIKEAAQVRALESPTRQEIVDGLAALGQASMTELAEHLGRAADSLYFHVRKLMKIGLVREVERRQEGRHVWAVYALEGRTPRIAYQAGMGRSISRVVAGALRLSLREFQGAIGRDDVQLDGPRRNLWGGRLKGWLSSEDLQEVNHLIDRLSQVLHGRGPGEGRRAYSFAWVFAPGRVRQRNNSNTKRERRS